MARPHEDSIAWEPQPGPQTLLVQCPAEECFYGGAVGGGKVISDNELVVTPFGYRRHGDLKVGDTISAADGSPTKVVYVTPREIYRMYRVTLDDGSSVVAGGPHLWNYSIAEKPWSKSGRKWKVGTTLQILALMEAGHKILLPICKPVTFTKSYRYNMRPLDPYLLGALLGDGGMTGDRVTLTSEDEHIVNRALGEDRAGWGADTRPGNRATMYYSRGETRKFVIDALERLHLFGKTAESKFVPEAYLWGTTDDRYALLHGLMDTDGFIDERGQAYFTSVSKQLATDVRWLVFSLGGRARITSRTPSYTYLGEKLKGQLAYTVTIRMPDNRLIVSLPRKVERANAWRENGNGELKRRIASIEYVGDEECNCIAVDHPESLYMVGDFIVTHNTDGLLGDYSRGIQYGSKWIGLFLRRYTPDMSYVIRRAQEIFCPVYGAECWKEAKQQFVFPGGAILQFRAADRDADALKHQGQQYAWIGFDELTQWETDYIYTYLYHRMRTANAGIPIRMRATGNPGGPGHNWVKERFIDIAPAGVPVLVTRKDGSTYYRVFIKSKLEDNRKLMEADPGYGGRIYEISDPVMARAMREGDWNIAVGAAFPEFDPRIHVIDNAPIPTDRKILRAMDWGYTDPYCCLWGFTYDGDLIIAGERYGWGGKANVGTQESPEVVRARLAGYERMEEIYVPYGWLDSQCWDTNSGIGMIAQGLMGKHGDPDHMVWHPWKKGPNSRVNQKQAVHQMLQVVNGKSRVKIMRRCEHLIRTLPSVVRDKHNNEDVDTNCEDHAYDTFRALIASGIPTKDEIRKRTMRQYQESYTVVRANELPGGGF